MWNYVFRFLSGHRSLTCCVKTSLAYMLWMNINIEKLYIYELALTLINKCCKKMLFIVSSWYVMLLKMLTSWSLLWSVTIFYNVAVDAWKMSVQNKFIYDIFTEKYITLFHHIYLFIYFHPEWLRHKLCIKWAQKHWNYWAGAFTT